LTCSTAVSDFAGLVGFAGCGWVGLIHTVLKRDEKSNGLQGWAAGVFCAVFGFILIAENCKLKKCCVFLFCYFVKTWTAVRRCFNAFWYYSGKYIA
jgi:heme O synthase-like polyprenyltransferase